MKKDDIRIYDLFPLNHLTAGCTYCPLEPREKRLEFVIAKLIECAIYAKEGNIFYNNNDFFNSVFNAINSARHGKPADDFLEKCIRVLENERN